MTVNRRGLDTRIALVGLTLIVVVSLVYSETLANGFVIDDRPFVQQNPVIRDLGNTLQMFTSGFWESTSASVRVLYRPLVTLSYALNYAVGGLDPLGYHLVNVLLHVANTLLLFAIVYLVSRRTLFAGAVAAVFGVHPVGTEAVAWVAQRSELMAAFFALGALVLYILAFPPVAAPERSARRAKWLLAGSVVAFLLGLLSKEGAVALVGAHCSSLRTAFRRVAADRQRTQPLVVALGASAVTHRESLRAGRFSSPARREASKLA